MSQRDIVQAGNLSLALAVFIILGLVVWIGLDVDAKLHDLQRRVGQLEEQVKQ